MLKELFKNKSNVSDFQFSERRYRRVFETAQDGILLLDFKTGMILDVNKFLIDLLGYSKKDFLKKHVWDVGVFKNIAALKENFKILRKEKYVRFENLPLETKTGRKINVEFVANAYEEGGETIIQCNIRDITDRVKAEEAVAISEIRYRRLFEAAKDGILTLDFETGKITDVNKFMIDLLGFSREILLKKYIWQLGFFKDEAAQKENLKILKKKKYIRFEDIPLKTNRGKRVDVEFVANAYEEGGQTVIQCNIRDITDRVKADERTLWLASFPLWNPISILEIIRKKGISFINPAAEKLFPDLKKKKTNNPFIADTNKYFKILFQAKIKFIEREVSVGKRWFHQTISFVKPDQIRIYSNEITEHKILEEKLNETNARNEAILSSIGDAVFACDKVGKIILFNKMAEGMVGMTAKEAMGRHYNKVIRFVSEIDGKVINDFIAKAIRDKKPAVMVNDVLLMRKDGGEIPVADSAAPILNTENEVIGCVVVFRDVTKERSIDKAKTELVSLASHQMRTPLSTISWYLEFLRSKDYGLLNNDQTGFVSEIFNASQRMTTLVNALLNVSRLEMGTFSIQPKNISIVNLAKANIEILRNEIKIKNLKFEERYDPKIKMFLADPKLLSIVFQNILSNAVKYTPAGGSIKFSLVKENKLLKIIVTDTGIGIPEYQQKKIFSKLFRADNASKMDPSGTGLGLYIVYEIVSHSGGSVWFNSQENKGTTFYVTYPLTGMNKKGGKKTLI